MEQTKVETGSGEKTWMKGQATEPGWLEKENRERLATQIFIASIPSWKGQSKADAKQWADQAVTWAEIFINRLADPDYHE